MSTVVAFLIGLVFGTFCGAICMAILAVGNRGEIDE